VLSIAGYDVLTGLRDAALEMLGSHPVELVITDHFLPAFPAPKSCGDETDKTRGPGRVADFNPVLPPGARVGGHVLIKGIPPRSSSRHRKAVNNRFRRIDPQSDGGSRS